MCGINGFFSLTKFDKNNIFMMNECINHRGPDDDGVFIENNKDYFLALGMKRLSIIDLDSGSQPIFSDDKNIMIFFNGEIYNYLSLKNNMISEGINFYSNSDTEVILKLYENYGLNSLKN